ncbi:hypothetical protein [Rhodococcus qingshengii]|uniref:hypothetical protein n=1 Tax=Rhodococcus qingshengii TaxID=334542 RepID=UPI00114CC568|nr:hypothetical protein [Rhodococcus qingshengii]
MSVVLWAKGCLPDRLLWWWAAPAGFHCVLLGAVRGWVRCARLRMVALCRCSPSVVSLGLWVCVGGSSLLAAVGGGLGGLLAVMVVRVFKPGCWCFTGGR